MTDQFLQFIYSIFKTYGIHAGFLIGLLYLFFFKYVPDQASAFIILYRKILSDIYLVYG